jgi:hypothetical protein
MEVHAQAQLSRSLGVRLPRVEHQGGYCALERLKSGGYVP